MSTLDVDTDRLADLVVNKQIRVDLRRAAVYFLDELEACAKSSSFGRGWEDGCDVFDIVCNGNFDGRPLINDARIKVKFRLYGARLDVVLRWDDPLGHTKWLDRKVRETLSSPAVEEARFKVPPG